MTLRTFNCEGCGKSVTYERKSGPLRLWCSERCRKETLYSRDCIDCGAMCNTDGRVTNPSIRCLRCEQTKNAEANERIRELWEDEGAPIWHIAEELDLREEQVRGRVETMRDRGQITVLHRKRNRTDWPAIQRFWNRGLTAREIADRLDTHEANINTMVQGMRKAGVELEWRGRDWARAAA